MQMFDATSKTHPLWVLRDHNTSRPGLFITDGQQSVVIPFAHSLGTLNVEGHLVTDDKVDPLLAMMLRIHRLVPEKV